MKRIVFFGDSLIAGYGLNNPSVESIPALIAGKLRSANLDYGVINAGISGDTTASAIDRLDMHLSGNIDIFVIELGANDFLRGISPLDVSHNLQAIISKVITYYPQASILLLGLALPEWAHGVHGTQSQAYQNIYKDLAAENKISLVPSFLKGVAGKPGLNMHDGVHPLAAGYQIAAENIWPELSKLINITP
jgi:acyl-CoA thioesterase-1